VKLEAAGMILSVVQRNLQNEESRARYVDLATRVVVSTEAKLWESDLHPSELLQISALIERVWFQIDALT
jgi:hypothetical protein